MSDVMPLMPAAALTTNVRAADVAPDPAAAGAFSSHIERALSSLAAAGLVPALNGGPSQASAAQQPRVEMAPAGDARDDTDGIDSNAEADARGLDAIRSLVAAVAEAPPGPSAPLADPTRSTVVALPSPVPVRPAGDAAPRGERRIPANGRAIVRDIDALEPELRVRVERVIGRMEREFGHDVRLAETWRSQERQNDLYAQGRTRPGEIVTWTTHSRHTEGLAADFVIDGGWHNPVAYERLQVIAREEGLRTLGARDAGHVELMVASQDATRAVAEASDIAPPEPQRTPAAGTVRAVASFTGLAQVAQVAVAAAPAVARVATIATVAQPGAAVRQTAEPATQGAARRETSASEKDDRAQSSGSESAFSDAHVLSGQTHGARDEAVAVHATDPVHTSDPVRATTAARAEQVEALRDMVRAQPVNGLVLRIDSADGIDDRIRIDVRGTRVDASIGVNDEVRATDLMRRIPELTRALEARGFEAGATQVHPSSAVERVQSAGGSAHIAERLAMDALTQGQNAQSESRSRDGDEPHARAQQHAFRERSRRDRQGDRT